MAELEQVFIERMREAEANISELQGAAEAEKNKNSEKLGLVLRLLVRPVFSALKSDVCM